MNVTPRYHILFDTQKVQSEFDIAHVLLSSLNIKNLEPCGYIQHGLFWSSKQDLALQEVIASRNTKLNERQCLFCVPYVTLSCTTC